ncbi:MFS transporter [Brevibacillus choshinensis]|uniref:MFS transporter n=1 Tax=Brevibacillus choshinensis TaxID=54911 RepID=A0ABX7FWG5_BRECH|nr:MFS transporter [Brevibacillus choshinensis]QRG70260.1 MFS transporter [Brevibacillus choshinensis]
MATLFLGIIYVAFISLGLPDALLGAAWPNMQADVDAPFETAGFLFMTMAAGTIVSSLASGTLVIRFGTGKITLVSCILTASALLGFAYAPSIVWLYACAVPLGLGAGAVDAGLNNYVAAHYKAHHMSWLHCFWGVGATLGPVIMAPFLSGKEMWRQGYLTVASIQFALVVILFFTLPLWTSRKARSTGEETTRTENRGVSEKTRPDKTLQKKEVTWALAPFLLYSGVEASIGLWGSSFLVERRDIPVSAAAHWISLYYAGITIGRFLTGWITFTMSNRQLIRTGQLIALSGSALLLLPLPPAFLLAGFMILGLGLAPIFPCMLHETPARFGHANSPAMMGYQMATAYTGSTFIPPLLGFAASYFSIGIFPFSILAAVVCMLFFTEQLNAIIKRRRPCMYQKQ